MAKLIDETGNEYGELVVVSRDMSDLRGEAKWICDCFCGNSITVTGTNLRNGKVASCGCMRERKKGSKEGRPPHPGETDPDVVAETQLRVKLVSSIRIMQKELSKLSAIIFLPADLAQEARDAGLCPYCGSWEIEYQKSPHIRCICGSRRREIRS